MEHEGVVEKKKYCGFTSYLEKKQITPEFINDFEYWTKKIFYHWKLFTDYENFQSICWEALLSKLDEFDPGIATIQTFCLSRINNEAWRFYMKTKSRRPEVDCENPVISSSLVAKDDSEVRTIFTDFLKYARKFGIDVNMEELYDDCREQKFTAPVLAYLSWKTMYDKGAL